jgi:hypothetical protein
MRRLVQLMAAFTSLGLAACEMASGDLRVQFVSPETYRELSCNQIGTEGNRIAARVAEISGGERGSPSSGLSLLTQPIAVTWPGPLSELSEDAVREIGKLKGEFQALERASTFKRCSYHFKQQTT